MSKQRDKKLAVGRGPSAAWGLLPWYNRTSKMVNPARSAAIITVYKKQTARRLTNDT